MGEKIQIVQATYGGVDVTQIVSDMVARGIYVIPVMPSSLGIPDPQVNVHKTMRITVLMGDGDTNILMAGDGHSIDLSQSVSWPILPSVQDGSFTSLDHSAFFSNLPFHAPAFDIMSGVWYTLAEGIQRPAQLHANLVTDFKEHTGNAGNALFASTFDDRSPVMAWGQRVAVTPGGTYTLTCYASNVSETPDLVVPIVLDVNGIRSRPLYAEVGRWSRLTFTVRVGNATSVKLKIWRDVIAPPNEFGGWFGLDDISFVPQEY